MISLAGAVQGAYFGAQTIRTDRIVKACVPAHSTTMFILASIVEKTREFSMRLPGWVFRI
jgi:hypothetical protein